MARWPCVRWPLYWTGLRPTGNFWLQALPDSRLRLTYADGQSFEVDLRQWIASSTVLRPLADPVLFAQARLGFGARSVDWIDDELDLGTDNLRNLAIEQSGGIGHERIWNWLHETGLTLEQAAQALGLSRRSLVGMPGVASGSAGGPGVAAAHSQRARVCGAARLNRHAKNLHKTGCSPRETSVRSYY